MLIRSKLIRAGGTNVEMGAGKDKRVYDFKPKDKEKPDENHVADVTNQADIARFLAIPEGYEIFDLSEETHEYRNQVAISTATVGTAADAAAADALKARKAELLEAVFKATGKAPNPTTSVAKLEKLLADAKAK